MNFVDQVEGQSAGTDIVNLCRIMARELTEHGHDISQGYAFGVSRSVYDELLRIPWLMPPLMAVREKAEYFLSLACEKTECPIPILLMPDAGDGWLTLARFEHVVEHGGINPYAEKKYPKNWDGDKGD